MPASSQTQLRSCVLRCGRSGFAVDYWGRNPCVGAVFLTHAHADHHLGLPRPSWIDRDVYEQWVLYNGSGLRGARMSSVHAPFM